jgi:hypothetical protein
MRKMLGILATAGLMIFGAGAASAQGVTIRIGEPGYNRVERRVVRDYRPDYRPVRVIERRVVRPARTRTVCNVVVRERIRPNGVVVRRPQQVCRQVVVGRGAYYR